MTKFKAKDFNTRSELENTVRNKLGLTPESKPLYSIEGTQSELAHLQLSDKNIFWGIICVCTDFPFKPSTQSERPNRGKVHDFGINRRKKKHAKTN